MNACPSLLLLPRLLCLGLCLSLLYGCSGRAGDPQAAFENKQYDRARELWLPRAEAGDPVAQNAIGTLYYLGLGVKRDAEMALNWFEQAARQGYPGAQRNAGMMYRDGRGTGQDFVTAYMWFYAADKQGNDKADAYISSLANKLTPNQQILAKRRADQFIINPTADYRPVSDEPRTEPRLENMRESG